MADVIDHSTECLISDKHINNTRQRRGNYHGIIIKIAVWTTILLSLMLAATAFMMFVITNYSSMTTVNVIAYDDEVIEYDDIQFTAIKPQLLVHNTIRVIAKHRAAKVILTRPVLPSIELDLKFFIESNSLSETESTAEEEDEPPESCREEIANALECVSWSAGASNQQKTRLILDELFLDPRAKCYNITMLVASKSGIISACLPLKNSQLYGGPIVGDQRWPSQISKPLYNVTYLSGYDGIWGVAERFWFTSNGEAIYVPPDIPLFVSQDSKQLCLKSQLAAPYHRFNASSVSLSAVLCTAENPRDVFLATSKALLGTPSSPPDSLMLKYPVWSTWARYKWNINTSRVMNFARDIKHYGFPNSQIEIDDRWEVCYGYSDFDNKTFPYANETIKNLHELGFRVTLWMHPFENSNCYSYLVARKLQVLVLNPGDNATDTVRWWDGRGGLIDFTKPMAANWYIQRLEFLRKNYKIDGFKFDAGEASYVPSLAMLYGREDLQPASLSTAYASIVAEANPGMAEMRSLYMAQRFPLIVRMDDKYSTWDSNNGIKSLIPTLLTLNMIGYSTIMPDMIGGNGYDNLPDKELFIRWLQVCVFMPVLQFSYAPWDYDQETIAIAKKYVDLHSEYHDIFMKLSYRKMKDSSPVNLPIWWIAQNDAVALTIDSEFMLGEELLVAPVLEKGALSRDIYLPSGTWREGLRPEGNLYQGPMWIRNHSAPLDHLPFFLLQSNDNESIDIINILLSK